jgi:hypothetical protein
MVCCVDASSPRTPVIHVDRADQQRFRRLPSRLPARLPLQDRCSSLSRRRGSWAARFAQFVLDAGRRGCAVHLSNRDYAANREVAATNLRWDDETPLPAEKSPLETTTSGGRNVPRRADVSHTEGRLRCRRALRLRRDSRRPPGGRDQLGPLLGSTDSSGERSRSAPQVPCGYASPVGVRRDRRRQCPRRTWRGQPRGFHLRNVNLGRDYSADLSPTSAWFGPAICVGLRHGVEERRGHQSQHLKLGYKYSVPLGCLPRRRRPGAPDGDESCGFGVSRIWRRWPRSVTTSAGCGGQHRAVRRPPRRAERRCGVATWPTRSAKRCARKESSPLRRSRRISGSQFADADLSAFRCARRSARAL